MPVRRLQGVTETPPSGAGGAARRGCSEHARAGRVRRPHYFALTHNQKSRAASAIWPPAQVACGRRADGVRPGPRRGQPASPPTTAGPHRRGGRLLPSGLPTVTQSSGPSLPRTYTVINRPLSRVFLSVERAFLNSQRARVARRNPPRVIGKPGSLPSLCLLGGRVCVSWKRLRADSA